MNERKEKLRMEPRDVHKVFENILKVRIDDYNKLIDKLALPNLSKTTIIKKLKESFSNEELSLFIGAGVSVPYSIPSWDELLQRLLLNTIKKDQKGSEVLSKLFTKIFTPNALIAGRYLKDFYDPEQKDNLKFESEIRKLLYEKIDKDYDSDTIKEIVKFCVASGRTPNIDSIVTYNYDDIIENSLEKLDLDLPYKSIFGVGMNPKKGEIPIYHVHGFLPRKGKLTKENIITLGESNYHDQYFDLYSWNNLVQLNKLREKTCLFIGISLTDPNMRRLLDLARLHKGSSENSHYIIKKRYDIDKIEKDLSKLLKTEDELLDEKSRARLKIGETATFLKEFVERFEEKDVNSLGVKCIWIDKFDEIPTILKSIRK